MQVVPVIVALGLAGCTAAGQAGGAIARKNFETPDEVRVFDKGRVSVVTLRGISVERAVLEPGWRWSTCVKPIAKTDSCRKWHVKYVVSGRQGLRMSDGRETEVGPGDFAVIPPGHDAWTVGDAPTVLIELRGVDPSGLPATLAKKNVSSPDQTKTFGCGRVDVLTLGSVTLERGTLEPGWKWSINVKPVAKTDSCQKRHVKYVVSGRQALVTGDGGQAEIGPGDFAIIPAGHDAWTLGTESTVLIEFPESVDQIR